ncbi:hypothetical protein NEOLEDRAFT_631587 [Neolentinus lepideus HHB14362 ss-1]|uniref:Uncharacterized protein n=1 Tax=Neolentinus lepideus HHB14362 ss-1 TaxID=1314782 RepID=A0A165QR24_9AGAM|nr:hypothetical protein NEOLEDRAFT_631587 [Neolentinus lepideus HHB14362 ss-1]
MHPVVLSSASDRATIIDIRHFGAPLVQTLVLGPLSANLIHSGAMIFGVIFSCYPSYAPSTSPHKILLRWSGVTVIFPSPISFWSIRTFETDVSHLHRRGDIYPSMLGTFAMSRAAMSSHQQTANEASRATPDSAQGRTPCILVVYSELSSRHVISGPHLGRAVSLLRRTSSTRRSGGTILCFVSCCHSHTGEIARIDDL